MMASPAAVALRLEIHVEQSRRRLRQGGRAVHLRECATPPTSSISSIRYCGCNGRPPLLTLMEIVSADAYSAGQNRPHCASAGQICTVLPHTQGAHMSARSMT